MPYPKRRRRKSRAYVVVIMFDYWLSVNAAYCRGMYCGRKHCTGSVMTRRRRRGGKPYTVPT